MAGNLPFELSKFGKHRRYLKKILNNTKASLHDILRSGYFGEDQLKELNLKLEDEEQIKDIIENPVGIIILGSKSWAKAAIVNELLGYALLPVDENRPLSGSAQTSTSGSNSNWRTIRMMYGQQTQVSLAVANHYELVEHLAVYDRVWHQIPTSDLEVREGHETGDPGYTSATLEIKLPHHLLADDVQIVVSPSTSPKMSFESMYHSCFDGVSPIVIYALTEADSLSPHEVDDLMELRRLAPKMPVFFIRAHKSTSTASMFEASAIPHDQLSSASELTESQQHLFFTNKNQRNQPSPLNSPPSSCASPTALSQSPPERSMTMHGVNQSLPSTSSSGLDTIPVPLTTMTAHSLTIFQELTSLGFLTPAKSSPERFPTLTTELAGSPRRSKSKKSKDGQVGSELVENFDNFPSILLFVRSVLQFHLVRAANTLHTLHMKCLRVFILTAFDMTRDILVTPKRIEYARQKEQQLFESLMAIANRKQEEIKDLISDTLTGMRSDLLGEVSRYEFQNNAEKLNRSSTFCCIGTSHSSDDESAATTSKSSLSSTPLPAPEPSRLVHQVEPGTACGPSPAGNLSSTASSDRSSTASASKISARDYQLALSEIQDFVLNHLNTAIAGKLIGSVDYLRDSYVGTLERCLSSLERYASSSNESPHESLQATNALKQILNAAYQVEINIKATSSLLRAFWEKMKALVTSSFLWTKQPTIDDDWKRKVASDILDSLSEWRLAKSICSQFKERLCMSHDQFLAAMKQLESLHSGRLEKTEEHRLRVRKVYAPKIARYALESTSLRDLILFGMPQLGREIGRGQYGVVYACDSWAGHSPVALKSVVPPDDKHWNDLAMEFYYTRSIPDHDRIVQIRGSVIDHSYGGGSTPAVLLIMDRLTRDLYSAIRNGLDWISRLQVAIDVVQGIRFLHSQGLVHRDIKLKNVLLDKRNRAKITDLGFCKPEAMMSGSIVGTPIHMAPELFSGKYDNSVDVYAFGILFWYICAGHVRLPYVFEQCQNKDQLWNCVRKGSRPEKLPQFDEECWKIMEQCWAGDPGARPLLGDVEPRLMVIHERYKNARPPAGYSRNYMRPGTRSTSMPYGTPTDRQQQQQPPPPAHHRDHHQPHRHAATGARQ